MDTTTFMDIPVPRSWPTGRKIKAVALRYNKEPLLGVIPSTQAKSVLKVAQANSLYLVRIIPAGTDNDIQRIHFPQFIIEVWAGMQGPYAKKQKRPRQREWWREYLVD